MLIDWRRFIESRMSSINLGTPSLAAASSLRSPSLISPRIGLPSWSLSSVSSSVRRRSRVGSPAPNMHSMRLRSGQGGSSENLEDTSSDGLGEDLITSPPDPKSLRAPSRRAERRVVQDGEVHSSNESTAYGSSGTHPAPLPRNLYRESQVALTASLRVTVADIASSLPTAAASSSSSLSTSSVTNPAELRSLVASATDAMRPSSGGARSSRESSLVGDTPDRPSIQGTPPPSSVGIGARHAYLSRMAISENFRDDASSASLGVNTSVFSFDGLRRVSSGKIRITGGGDASSVREKLLPDPPARSALRNFSSTSDRFRGFLDQVIYTWTNRLANFERRVCCRMPSKWVIVLVAVSVLALPFWLAALRCTEKPFRLALPSTASTPRFSLHIPVDSMVRLDHSVDSSVDELAVGAKKFEAAAGSWRFLDLGYFAFKGFAAMLAGTKRVLHYVSERATAAAGYFASSSSSSAPANSEFVKVSEGLGENFADGQSSCPSSAQLAGVGFGNEADPCRPCCDCPAPPLPDPRPATSVVCSSCQDPKIQAKIDVLSRRIDELNAQLVAVENRSSNAALEARLSSHTITEESDKIWSSVRRIEADLARVRAEQDQLRSELAVVVRENVDVILRQVVSAFHVRNNGRNDIGANNDVLSSPASGFASWFKSQMEHEQEVQGIYLEAKIKEYINSTFGFERRRREDEEQEREERSREGLSSSASIAGAGNGDNHSPFLDVDLIAKIVQEQIRIYDADKTGKADFALESSGGSILSTRCTEEYKKGFAEYSFLGIPIWWRHTNPRNAIQPRVSPGECWAFKGDQGYLVIKLSGYIYVTGFTVEHIPKSIAVTGDIKSAPKDFVLYGLIGERDPLPVEFGSYTYNAEGAPIQYFPVQNPSRDPYNVVELNIRSNWGHPDYTCLYRIRVHGQIP